MNKNTEKVRKYTDKELIRRVMQYLGPFKKKFIICFFLLIFSILSDIIQPLLLGKAIEYLQSSDLDFSKIIALVIFACGVMLIGCFVQYFLTIMLQKIGQSIIYNLRNDVYSHILSLSHAQMNQMPVGKFVTRVTSDCNTLNDLFTNVLINLFRNILTLIGIVCIVVAKDIRLGSILLCTLPIIVVFTIFFRKTSKNAYRKVKNSLSELNGFLSENLSGMKIIQVFNQEEKKKDEFDYKNNALKKASLKEILVFAIFRPTIYLLYIIADTLVIYIGVSLYLSGYTKYSGSFIFTYTEYTGRFFSPLHSLADQFNTIQSSFAACEKIFTVLDTKPDIEDSENPIEMEIKGNIVFDHVWFAYTDENWILKDVSFEIKENQTVAFVGSTGSGKTTILSLIVRNYDIQKGHIYIDGVDIKDISLDCLRSHFGQMLQDVFLFSGTIRENIRLLDSNISDEEIEKSIAYVNADSFIHKLPGSLDYLVKERGNNFSTGQRQLISFARTIAHHPSVMILDEATANIDTETEVLIQDSLEKMMNVNTMLIVAHRLSTIQHADKIIVLSHGKILESGTHQELLAKKGNYYSLYKLQYEKRG